MPESLLLLYHKLEPTLQPVAAWCGRQINRLPGWFQSLSALFILMLAVVIWFREPLITSYQSLTACISDQQHAGHVIGKKDCLSILISPLEGDEKGNVTANLQSALRDNFEGVIDVGTLPQSEQLILPHVGMANEDMDRLRTQAKAILGRRQADLIIWGKLAGNQMKLYIDVPDNKLHPGLYTQDKDKPLSLPKDLPDDISVAISALVLQWAAPVTDAEQSGFPQADKLLPLLEKLRLLVRNLPLGLQDYRGNLLFSQGLLADCIGDETGQASFLKDAIQAYQEALAERTRQRTPLQWATIQNNLGNALSILGERENSPQRLKAAVTAFHDALKVWTQKQMPLDWAIAQNNLGNALWRLGERENSPQRLEAAVAAYHEALKVRTRERVPLDWAMTQNNLGNALWRLGERENSTQRLETAVMAYHEALKEWKRPRVPLQWAGTQNNLGNALRTLGERENNPQRLKAAITAFDEALKEWIRDLVPLQWAMTKNNLGSALATLGELENSPHRLEAAVTAFHEALKERTRKRAPLDWAATQNNLGVALATLGELENSPHRLEAAVTSYQEALKEYTRVRAPLQWATTQNNLGNALSTLGKLQSNNDHRHAYEQALSVYDAAGTGYYVDGVKRNLAQVNALLQ